MKKFGRSPAVICAIALPAACLPFSSCAIYLDLFEENYTEWYAEDGRCSFTAALNGFGGYGYFTVNGKKVRAYFSVTFDAALKIEFPYSDDLGIVTESSGGASYDTSYGECVGLIEGRRNGDLFHVSDMRVGFTHLGSFDLSRRKVDPLSVDARDYTACTWTANDGCLTIESYRYGVDEYLLSPSDGSSAYFKWLDGNRFEIADKRQYEEERTVLACGSYSNRVLELSLTFEKDDAFGLEGRTVALTGEVD